MIEDIDVVFLSSKSIFAKIIRFFTGGEVTHVALVCGAMAFHSDIPEGVQELPTYKLDAMYDYIDSFPIGEHDVSELRKHIGKPYDYLSLPLAYLGHILRRKLYGGDRAYICTEFVTRVLWGRAYAMSPEALYHSLAKPKP